MILIHTFRVLAIQSKAFRGKESELRAKGIEALTAEQEMEILTKSAKQRRDLMDQFTKAGRDDLAEKESQELAILEEFLPAQMSEEEIAAAVDGAIATQNWKTQP